MLSDAGQELFARRTALSSSVPLREKSTRHRRDVGRPKLRPKACTLQSTSNTTDLVINVGTVPNQQLQYRYAVEQNRRRKGSIPVLTGNIRHQPQSDRQQRYRVNLHGIKLK